MRIKFISIILLMCFSFNCLYAQDRVYDVNLKKDGIILGVGLGFSLLGDILVKNTDAPQVSDLSGLTDQDVNRFDRWAVDNDSKLAGNASDVILYTSVSLPLLSYFSKECRLNQFDVAIMGIETLLVNNGISNIIKGSVQRLRPRAYNQDIALEDKLNRGTRLSFLSGHTSNTAAMSFFTARVFMDLHPNMTNKNLILIPAALIPATISYLRVEAGKHFPTDVLAGYALGAFVGYMIPTIHKNKNMDINISPLGGISMSLTF